MAGRKIFGSALLQPVRSVCVSLGAFLYSVCIDCAVIGRGWTEVFTGETDQALSWQWTKTCIVYKQGWYAAVLSDSDFSVSLAN